MIRSETSADDKAVRHVNRLAFGQEEEARLVDALRNGGFVRASMVAEVEGQVVGHILFSDLAIMSLADTISALALAPMAVLPKFQRQGIGTALVQRGLEVCRQQGHQIVVVVGHANLESQTPRVI
ncbi:MAG TPA: N-acetyltransferase [Pirellulales bacterium]|nr:N-acetyltransferase [Pirellulales bacterium]